MATEVELEFDQIKGQVMAEGGVQSFRMEILRDAAGYAKLGKWVVQEISTALRRRGLGHTPDPLPSEGWAQVLVYQLGSEIEAIVHAVDSPSPDGADTLRALVNQDSSETLKKIRALIEASAAE